VDVRILNKCSYSGYWWLHKLAVLTLNLLQPVHVCNNKFMLTVPGCW